MRLEMAGRLIHSMKQGGGVVQVVTGDGRLTVTLTNQIAGADGTWRKRNYDRMWVLKLKRHIKMMR